MSFYDYIETDTQLLFILVPCSPTKNAYRVMLVLTYIYYPTLREKAKEIRSEKKNVQTQQIMIKN